MNKNRKQIKISLGGLGKICDGKSIIFRVRIRRHIVASSDLDQDSDPTKT